MAPRPLTYNTAEITKLVRDQGRLIGLNPHIQHVLMFTNRNCPKILKNPTFLKALLVTGGSAAFIAILIGSLGFGAAGIVAGSPAALFQGAAYGAATPAAGWFAGATAAGMTGAMAGIQAGAAAVVGAVAGGATWLIGKKQGVRLMNMI
ncbi:uncharacterized protein KY384_007138 [Bacidia gigantensis]|uniref:uncharacterized protein n=1 Tax=Bacidia gigantensis TaxID=2732470 RepID=UPI001D059197|nr:uncharacterized protein KY384_007138 [Bacidia gigantensis]KAG8528221.1 hypothetical protein KY384_007138 [Bacidia gigantensis]